MDALPGRARAWAATFAPHRVVGVEPAGGGMTNTKWVLRLAEGDPLVLRWSDPMVWGAVGREHVRREALACRLLAGSGLPCRGWWPATRTERPPAVRLFS